MTVEREIAGITLPFVAGILTVAYFPALYSIPPTTFLFTTTIGIILLTHPKHKEFNNISISLLIFLTIYCCGTFVGISQQNLSLSDIDGAGVIGRYASGFGTDLKTLIARVPFENEESRAILTALITGDRNELSREITDTFRSSGASHILALSGLHLGIIYGILKTILKVTGNTLPSKISKAVIIVASCGFYTLATGASPSIVRAFLFILLGETAALTGRFKSTASILFAALFIQLLFNPVSVQSVGFQLSYAAMTGIAYIYPKIKKIWPDDKNDECKSTRPLRWIWNSASMSIACQLTTGPLAYIYFGTFPQYFLLTNIIALPLVGLIIPLGLLAMVFESIGITSHLLVQATEGLISIMTESLEIISSL